jgi:hypothetical protein
MGEIVLPSTITIELHTWPPKVLAVQVHKCNGGRGADTIATVNSLFPEIATELYRNEVEVRTKEAAVAGGLPYMRRYSKKNNVKGYTPRSRVSEQGYCYHVKKNNGETLAFEQNLSRALRISECAEAVCHRVAMEASQQADQEAEEADQEAAYKAMQKELQSVEANAQADQREQDFFSNFNRQADLAQESSKQADQDAADSLFDVFFDCSGDNGESLFDNGESLFI